MIEGQIWVKRPDGELLYRKGEKAGQVRYTPAKGTRRVDMFVAREGTMERIGYTQHGPKHAKKLVEELIR